VERDSQRKDAARFQSVFQKKNSPGMSTSDSPLRTVINLPILQIVLFSLKSVMATAEQKFRALELLSGYFDQINTDKNEVISEEEIHKFLAAGHLAPKDVLAIQETLKEHSVSDLSNVSVLDEYQDIPNSGISKNDLDAAPLTLAFGMGNSSRRPPGPPSRATLPRPSRLQQFAYLFSTSGSITDAVPEEFIEEVVRSPLQLQSSTEVSVESLRRTEGPLGTEYEITASLYQKGHTAIIHLEEDHVLNNISELSALLTAVDGIRIRPVKVEPELLKDILEGNYQLSDPSKNSVSL
jgi:hypothetical protein